MVVFLANQFFGGILHVQTCYATFIGFIGFIRFVSFINFAQLGLVAPASDMF